MTTEIQAHIATLDQFQPGKVRPLTWEPGEKPRGGLWTSTWTGPETISDWVRWCSGEHWGDHEGGFVSLLTPDPTAKVYLIDSLAALLALHERYPHRESVARYGYTNWVDWRLVAFDYDAVRLTQAAHFATRLTHPGTYSWDCESTCWFRWRFTDVEHLGVLTVSKEAFA